MKKILFILTIFITQTLHGEPFGIMTVNSCYQQFSVPTSGTFKILEGVPVSFGSTNLSDFNSFEVWDHIDNAYITTLYVGQPLIPFAGNIYEIKPVTNAGVFNPNGWPGAVLIPESLQ